MAKRGLTENDGNMKSQVRLLPINAKVNSLVFILGSPYIVATSAISGGILLNNGLFANPVVSQQVNDNTAGIAANAAGIEANAAGIEWDFKSGGGVLLVNHKYIFTDSLGYIMPVMGAAKQFVGLSANGGNTPTMTVDDINTAEHFIKALDLVDNGDTTFQIDADDNGKEYLAISNATNWEI